MQNQVKPQYIQEARKLAHSLTFYATGECYATLDDFCVAIKRSSVRHTDFPLDCLMGFCPQGARQWHRQDFDVRYLARDSLVA